LDGHVAGVAHLVLEGERVASVDLDRIGQGVGLLPIDVLLKSVGREARGLIPGRVGLVVQVGDGGGADVLFALGEVARGAGDLTEVAAIHGDGPGEVAALRSQIAEDAIGQAGPLDGHVAGVAHLVLEGERVASVDLDRIGQGVGLFVVDVLLKV